MESNSTLPSEETISSLVRSVYTAMTEEAAQERGDNRRNSQSVEEELSRRFQLPRRGGSDRQFLSVVPTNSSAQRPEQFNPRVNYGSSGGKGKGKSRSCPWKGKSAIEKSTKKEITTRELILLPSPEYDEVPRSNGKRKLQELGLIIDGFPLDKSWNENQLELKVHHYHVCIFQVITGEGRVVSLVCPFTDVQF